MPDLWLPGAQRFTASRSWTMDGGGRCFANWHSTENSPSARASDLARYLIGIRAEPHLVWNPWTGELCQLLPANRGGSVLMSGNHAGSVNLGVECIGRAGVVGQRPLYDSPMIGFDRILNWMRSWGIPDAWPAGPPLPYPQSAGFGNPQRAKWGPSGHYSHSQWPGNDHGDPGLTKTNLWTGSAQPQQEDLLNVPTITPFDSATGQPDVGHPGAMASTAALLKVINPSVDVSTPAKLADVVEIFQAFAGLKRDRIVGPITATAIAERAWSHK